MELITRAVTLVLGRGLFPVALSAISCVVERFLDRALLGAERVRRRAVAVTLVPRFYMRKNRNSSNTPATHKTSKAKVHTKARTKAAKTVKNPAQIQQKETATKPSV